VSGRQDSNLRPLGPESLPGTSHVGARAATRAHPCAGTGLLAVLASHAVAPGGPGSSVRHCASTARPAGAGPAHVPGRRGERRPARRAPRCRRPAGPCSAAPGDAARGGRVARRRSRPVAGVCPPSGLRREAPAPGPRPYRPSLPSDRTRSSTARCAFRAPSPTNLIVVPHREHFKMVPGEALRAFTRISFPHLHRSGRTRSVATAPTACPSAGSGRFRSCPSAGCARAGPAR
jgi:hypothetical protein